MKSKILATLALLAISVLPGCGKSNNGVVTNGVYGAGYIGGANGQGGCYDLRQMNAAGQQQIQVAFSGYNQYSQSLAGTLTATNSAVGGGYAYSHNNGYGDSVTVYINGNQMTAIATLSYGTISYINTYGNGYLCGLYVNSGISPGSSQMSSSSYLLGSNYRNLGISI